MQFFAPRQIIPNRGCSASASCFALAAPQSLPSLLSLSFFSFFIASSSSSSSFSFFSSSFSSRGFNSLWFLDLLSHPRGFVPRLISSYFITHFSLPPQSIYESPRFTPNLIYSCRSSTVHQLLFVAPFLFDCLRLYFHNITFLSCFSCVHICYHLSSLLFFLSVSPSLHTIYYTCLITRIATREPCGRQRCSLRLGFLLSSSVACLPVHLSTLRLY